MGMGGRVAIQAIFRTKWSDRMLLPQACREDAAMLIDSVNQPGVMPTDMAAAVLGIVSPKRS